MDDKRVLVAIRVRPKIEGANNALQQNERYHLEAAAKTSDSSVRLSDGKVSRDAKTHNFSFDLVFDKDTTQLDVYEETTLDAVDAVLIGCNATIMTYGQTGSGKTYTILGTVKKNPLTNDIITSDTGLFLRALKDILSYAEQRSKDVHLVVGLSVLEIYLDEVRDLLSPEATPPTVSVSVIRDTLSIPNITYKPIRDLNDAVQAYKLANARRVSRATSANDTSSRSHAVFSIEVFQQQRTAVNPNPMEAKDLCELRERHQLAVNTNNDVPGAAGTKSTPLSGSAALSSGSFAGNQGSSMAASPSSGSPSFLSGTQANGEAAGVRASNPLLTVTGMPPIMFSKLVLTDLAGSEKMKNSKVRGEGLEELKKINASLTALGNVVHSLYEGAKHIPYRDSKLTIILRESFAAPNSKIVLIANASPTVLTFDETLSTMFFADKVKGMKVENPQSADVARMEVEYLSTMKTLEEIAGDLRIAAAVHDNRLAIRRHGLPSAVDRPLGIVRRQPNASQSARDKELKALFSEVSLSSSRALQEQRRAALQEELAAVEAATRDEVVSSFKNTRRRVEEMLQDQARSRQRDESEAADFMRELQQSISDAESSLAKTDEALAKLQPVALALPAKKAAADALLLDLNEKVAVMERRVFEANREHEDDWTTHQSVHQRQEQQWGASSRFAIVCLDFWGLRSEYIDWRRGNSNLMVETSHTKFESETADVTMWIRGALIRIARNAVVGAISRMRRAPSTRPASRSMVGGSRAGSMSAEAMQGARRVDPNSETGSNNTSVDDVADIPRSVSSAKKRGTLYDQPTLMKEIQSYVQYGCTILKYGRKGAPHYRIFYVQVSEEEGTRLCWDESDDGRRLGKGSSISLDSVTSVILGQYTSVFSRIPGHDGFYNSFSVEYISKQQSRTLDLVCDTDAELESWVIAICHFTKKNPKFRGEMVNIRSMPNYGALSSDEATLCARWHITPDVFLSCRRRVVDAIARSKTTRVRMTPGDVRMLTGIDIFRSCALWAHFSAAGMVENPFDKLYSYLDFGEEED